VADNDTVARQSLVKIVALLEEIAHELKGGASSERFAELLEQYANELRDDLHRSTA
jgi:hypothetical protein